MKSAFIPMLALCAALCGCADAKLPNWFTGEPDDSVIDAPRMVATPPAIADKTYPNLATVPAKPKDYSTLDSRTKMIDQLDQDAVDADIIRDRVNHMPVEPVLSAPPAPATQP